MSSPLPTSSSSAAALDYHVAIVGYGPVGATLANLLAERGVRVLVLEREAAIYALPRAVHFDAECMRVFQAAGVADALQDEIIPIFGMRFVNPEGRLLIDWQRPLEPGAQGWYASYRFHQPRLEEILRARASEREELTVLLRHEVFALDEEADHVRVRYEDMSTGRLHAVRVAYVVGCDGARSLVRRLIGTELEDLQQHERWLVIDALLKRPRPDLGDDSIQYCDPSRPATYVRGVGHRRRWELMLLAHEDVAEQTRPERIWELLSKWITPEDADLERHAVYTFHSVVARGWRRGRLLIAGDAAHQTPPFLGQGMCAGIRDVANLGWKLADVALGRAADSLLDTYESERSPHVREFIQTAVRLGSVIQTMDPEVARARDLAMAKEPERFVVPQPALGAGAHEGRAPAGELAPQPRTRQGGRTDEEYGYEFIVLTLPELEVEVRTCLQGSVPCVPAHDEFSRQWLQERGVVAALVRPDRYVAAAARSLEEVPGLQAWLPGADVASGLNAGVTA